MEMNEERKVSLLGLANILSASIGGFSWAPLFSKICKNKVEAESWFTGLSALICRGQHGSQVQHIDGIRIAGLPFDLEYLSEANPSADMDEIVKAIASRVTEVMPKDASFTSSQIATSSNGFDSSVMSTAATTRSSGSTVTDLGVVGRGIKRASIKPISAEPAAKKPALDSPSLQGDSSINSEVVPATQTDESS
ncbi:Tetratricopeptide repeat (TPR)-like superfamily protein [Zea mays]|uniref:Tetratricopeptide repeat (TPR)-like superfamily protein n=2 Tax=Zea mays TaxID=4577 RepID=A0A1D6Q399_MAIZE|nr:Tetratricopeptide repeat (TPR)-like superfamily protein [Zea mays]